MTRMIERWFPCKEVSDNSESGWGSGNSEVNLLADFPLRDWRNEPTLPFASEGATSLALDTQGRLESDVGAVLHELGRRFIAAMEGFFPRNVAGAFPWGYVWAVSLPCQECG